MDWAHIIQAFLSLIFVIGLLLLSLWSFKCLESKGIKSRFIKKLKADSRLNIIEYKRIDNKNALVYLVAIPKISPPSSAQPTTPSSR